MAQRSSAPIRQFDQTPPSTTSRLLVWFSVAALLLSMPLLFNIVGRIQAEARMQAEVDRMTKQVGATQARLTGLRNALKHAKSDAYVEYWARVHARWGKPGEIVVVPPATEEPAQLWWESFLK